MSQFVSFSTTVLREAVLLIIGYLQSSLHQSLLFSSTFSLDVRAFYNADWAGDVMDCKSPTGLCVFLGDSIFPGKVKSKLLLHVLLSRLNTVLRLQLLQKYFGCAGDFLIWEFHPLPLLLRYCDNKNCHSDCTQFCFP